MKNAKFYRQAALIAIETVAVIAVLLGVAAGIVALRLGSGPLDIGFAKDSIEAALRDPKSGAYVSVGDIALEWPDLAGPLLLHIKDARLFSSIGTVTLAVDQLDISLSKSQLLIGHVAPVSIILSEPELRLVRQEDGHINVGFLDHEAYGPTNPDTEKRQTTLTERVLGALADEEGRSDTPLARLTEVRIKNADFQVEDRILESSWVLPDVDLTLSRTDEGLRADLYAGVPDAEEQESYAKAQFLVSWDSKNVNATINAHHFPLRVLANKIPKLGSFADPATMFDAKIEAVLSPDLKPLAVRAAVTSAAGSLSIPAYGADNKQAYKDFSFEAFYDAQKEILEVSKASITAGDVTVNATANLKTGATDITGPVNVSVAQIKQADIDPLWPESLKDDSSHEWIVKKLSDGTLHDLKAAIEVAAHKGDEGWDFDVSDVNAEFAFEGMSANYRPPLMSVKNAKGKGVFTLKDEKLAVTIDHAEIGDLKIKSAQLDFSNIVKVGAGIADLDIKLAGPVKTGLEYVSSEPIAVDHKFDPALVKGQAEVAVKLHFPTHKDVKKEEVKVEAEGTLTDVSLPNVVKGLALEGGPLAVVVKGNEFTVKGSGLLSGRPVTLNYQEFLNSKGQAYSNRVTATLNVDPPLRAHFGIGLDDFLEGPAKTTITYTKYQDGRGEADITADLHSARLFFKSFDYEKPTGVKGSATLKAVLKNDILQEVQDLTVMAPELLLDKMHLGFRQNNGETELAQGATGRFSIGETVGQLDFTIDPSGLYKIAMTGSVLDMRPFMDKSEEEKLEEYNEPPMQISVSVDRLRAADESVIQHGRLYVDIDSEGRFNQLEMDGIAGGNMYLRYKPDASGKRVFRFEAADAGATLKAFGIYDKIVGGKMMIYGEPIRGVNDRNLVGLAEITNFKVVNAPTLTRLLNALSLPGLITLLTNEGLSFAKLEAKFDWLYRKGGSTLVLKEGRTSGSSVGFTFDGVVDKKAGTMNIEGTMVPISEVNSLIGSIPIIGDIVTGGTGSLIAATYGVKGNIKEPEVFVNPLSVLAPGILRRILFESSGPPKPAP